MFFVYVLKCSDGTLYTGYTNDIAQRMEKHKNGLGAKYVRARLPFKHIYTETFSTKQEAMKREYQIKRWNRERKIKELKLLDL
jgi:putative endonuclease